jgi:hypothetical protein
MQRRWSKTGSDRLHALLRGRFGGPNSKDEPIHGRIVSPS